MPACPKIIGLLGGIASGKSTVAELMAERGAVVVNADALAHEALRDPGIIAQIQRRWGAGVLDAEGQVDRRKLADAVFGAEGEIDALNALVHPAVADASQRQIAAATRAGAPAVVLDAALLIEANMLDACDALVFVDAPETKRKERARAQRGWDANEIRRREQRQAPLDEKRRRARHVVRNDGSLNDLRAHVQAVWRAVIGG